MVILKNAANDVDDTKIGPIFYLDVSGVLMLWKHKAAGALLEEVHAGNIISLKIDVLIFCCCKWFEQGENPDYERLGFVAEIRHVFVFLIVKECGELSSKFVRQIIKKIVEIFNFFSITISERLFQSGVKVERH